MKKFVMQLAVCIAITAPAVAEPTLRSKPVQCAPPIEVINHYILQSKLEAMFIAVAQVRTQYDEIVPTAISFWANPTTGQFVLIEGDKTEVCVISLGDNIDFNVSSQELLGMYLPSGNL